MNTPTKQDQGHRYAWVIKGLLWGGVMFIIMEILFPLGEGKPLTAHRIGLGVILWSLGGLLFGWTDKKLTAWSLARERRKKERKAD